MSDIRLPRALRLRPTAICPRTRRRAERACNAHTKDAEQADRERKDIARVVTRTCYAPRICGNLKSGK